MKLIVLIISLFIALNNQQAFSAENFLIPSAESISPTEYFPIKLQEFKLPPQIRSTIKSRSLGGGAITPYEDESLIFASSNGYFFKINTKLQSIASDFLPRIDLGDDYFLTSKHISYFESYPRIHDITYGGGTFYVSYDHYNKTIDRIEFVIEKLKLGSSKEWERIYTSPPLDVRYYTVGNGGKMQIKDGIMYFTVGDNSLDRINQLPSDLAAQNVNIPWGKVNSINLKTNKFSTVSIGHRNQQGLVMLRDGRIIASEHGPRGGDELNIISKGKNYGWPIVSYGTKYNSYEKIHELPLKAKHSGLLKILDYSYENQHNELGGNSFNTIYTEPIFTFIPSIAPTQLIELTNFNEDWDGQLLMGSLKAMSLYRIKLIGNRVLYTEQIFIGQRIRDLKQLNNEIWMLTDNSSLIKLQESNQENVTLSLVKKYQSLGRCSSCHSLVDGENSISAPNLKGIINQPLGTRNFENYSMAFKSQKGKLIWDESNLRKFLKNPSEFIPNTSMPNLNLNDAQISEVIEALSSIADKKH